MRISFENDKEIFNGKEYPIGSAFTSIYNRLSSLTYCNNFILDTYKDETIEDYKKIARINKQIELSKPIIETLGGNYEEYLVPQIVKEIEIENVSLSQKEFTDLIFFIDFLDEFIRLISKDKRLNTYDRFIFFFNGINKYNLPREFIENKKINDDYNNLLNEMFNNIHSYYNNTPDIQKISENHYNDILENDRKILKKITNSTNYTHIYECKDFIEVLLISYLYFLKNNFTIKQCKYCKRFFIAKNGHEEFCNNIRPQPYDENNEDYKTLQISCREYNKRFPNKVNKSTVDDTIAKIYQRIQKRVRTGNESEEYKENWKNEVKEMKKNYINDYAFIQWLENESDTHQIRRKKNGSPRTNKK